MMSNEMRDKLFELLTDCEIEYAQYLSEECDKAIKGDVTKQLFKRLEFYADHLIENGVVVPPCKVGDTVYCIEYKTIHECIVTLVKTLTYEDKTVFFMETECEIEDPFYSDGRKMKHGIYVAWEIEWGSWHRAFPTKEAAEQKLKEMRGG